MGDRTNPIKFGPEWLRNLSREPTASPSGQAATGRDGVGSGTAPPGMGGLPTANRPVNSNTNTSRVLLARLRYGREEMLALYDRHTAEAPVQLKSNETLYQPVGKPPLALNTSFDDDNRERQGPGGLLTSDRYPGAGRGRGAMGLSDNRGRGLATGEIRGKARGYNRQTSAGRGWHANQRNTYSGMPDDDPNQPTRLWNSSTPSSGLRPNNGEQPDWQNKQQQYRLKRQTSTNWRQQHGRDDGEEWRSSDGTRRPQEKWADWGWQQESSGRPNQDKQWHSNRRTWVGGESNDDALPEWAVDNAEACGGSFDSTGAFHGYSNDDSNLPKPQEASYPLMKSHTHVRSKTAEEGSESWWASEKAKKLSPKRFDASEIQFKKPLPSGNSVDKKTVSTPTGSASSGSSESNTGAIPKNTHRASSSDRSLLDKTTKKSESIDEDSPKTRTPVSEPEEIKNKPTEDAGKEKVFESRPENNDKPNEDKGNFQSVLLTPNNTLRQKHQNIVVSPTESPKRQSNIMQYMETTNQSRPLENIDDDRKKKENNKIVEDILQMSLDDGIPTATMNQLLTNHNVTVMISPVQQPNSQMQMRMSSSLQGIGLNNQNNQNMTPSSNLTSSGMPLQPIGITNSMLNASFGLPMPNSNSGLPMQGMPPSLVNPGLPNPNSLAAGLQGIGGGNMQPSGIQQANLQTGNLQSGQSSNLQVGGLQMPGLPGSGMQTGPPRFQPSNASIPGMGNNSLFNNMPHASNLANHSGDNVSSFRLQQLASQSFNNFMYSNMMSHPPPPLPNMGMQHSSADQWYYEDPNKTIQGPFSSQEMFSWYRAGFFSPTLMVRRECEVVMRPLGTYGPMPFGQMDILPPFPMGGGFDLHPQQSRDNMINPQQGLGIDVPTSGHPFRLPPFIHSPRNMPFNPRNPNQVQIQVPVETVGPRPDLLPPLPQPLPMPPYQLVQNNEMESLWGQPSNNAPNRDMMWMQSMNNNNRTENNINNLPLYFWDSQPSDLPNNPLLPEKMKTEEEILAQMRANQPQPTSPMSFLAEPPPAEGDFASSAALHLDQLQKLIQKDESLPATPVDVTENEPQKPDLTAKAEQNTSEVAPSKPNKTAEIKPVKETLPKAMDNGKAKSKDNTAKSKGKNKAKEEKKDEPAEVKEEEVQIPKRSAEPSPSPKNKKEEKSNKKDLEKEKKEWIKEGFTIVKGAEKNKDNKKKTEEVKVAEEVEKKRKDEEKALAEERKRQVETIKKQQELQYQQQPSLPRQVAESISKKAPWSASSQGLQSSTIEGPTLAEIQRLEREKKLEQMKEQQHMMQIMAQQQAAALAREQFAAQEIQAGLGWAKKPTNTALNLAEIQAETRKQAAAAAVASAVAVVCEEMQPLPPPGNHLPWGSVQNGGGTAGFWDSPPAEPVKPIKPVARPDFSKPEPKPKKKVTVMTLPKQENSPSVEFELWCTNMLVSWRDTSIDIPTFVSFLKDIESPYEVKDYVKCYLGDTREASDFARQFLERRSRFLRVGTVTPSDDLCSPAVAINPRTNSGSDFTEVKGKGKKTKKNKMLKVDARNILGFSVTASEDRINVGDIDTV